MNGYRTFVTTQISKTLTEGTSSDLSALIFGNWAELYIGQWGGIDIMVNPYTKAKESLIEYIIESYMDVNVRHAASFAISKDVDATTPA